MMSSSDAFNWSDRYPFRCEFDQDNRKGVVSGNAGMALRGPQTGMAANGPLAVN